MPIDVQPISTDLIGVKWKEQYASAALNRRPVGITPPGIYRGLTPTEDPGFGDRTVQVSADPTKSDHVAVFETSTGYSINYRDDVSGSFTLDLSGYASARVVIALFVNYEIGVDTTATFRTYTETEFNALSAVDKNELVVLGTVDVPASGPIPAGSITIENRTLASQNIQKGTVLDPPFIRNTGFELGVAGAYHRYSSAFWDKTSLDVGEIRWIASTTEAWTGLKSIEMYVTVGPVTGRLAQHLGVPVVESQVIFLELYVKQIKTVVAGDFQFFVEYGDADGDVLSTATVDLDAGSVDTAFRKVTSTIAVPSGAFSVRAVGVEVDTMNPLTADEFAYIDNVQLFIQPEDARQPYDFESDWRQAINASSITLRDPDSTGGFPDRAALLHYEKGTPSGEGQVTLEEAEQGTGSKLPPAVNLQGRIASIGEGLLQGWGDATKARVAAPVAPGILAGTSDYTLMWESQVDVAAAAARFYAKFDGTCVLTTNAKFDGANWNKDPGGAGSEASRFDLRGNGVEVKRQEAGTNVWGDGAWTETMLGVDSTRALQSLFGEVDITKHLSVGEHITLGGELDDQAGAETARIKIDRVADATNERTLAMEFVSATGYGHRVYLSGSDTNSLEIVANARWIDSTNKWTRDIDWNSGKYTFSRNRFEYRFLNTALNATDWNDDDGDGGWELSKFVLDGGDVSNIKVGNTDPSSDKVGQVQIIDGRVYFSDPGPISNPLRNQAIHNQVRAKNTVKAWGWFKVQSNEVGVETRTAEGYNFAAYASGGSGDVKFTLATAMDDAEYAVIAQIGSVGFSPQPAVIIAAHDLQPASFELSATDHAGGVVDLYNAPNFAHRYMFWMVLGVDT